MADKNIAIIGAGPIGSIMAAHLARNRENVYLVDIKKELISAVEKEGITITGVGDNFTTQVKGTEFSVSSLTQFVFDYIFVAVKLYSLDALLKEMELIFKPGQKIFLLQNGIDNEEMVAKKFSREDVLRFVINYAGMIVKPGTVKMAFFNPPNYIGSLSSQNESLGREIAEVISEAGLETAFSPEIKKHEWKKTSLNAALMPVCASTGLTMKEAMDQEESRFLCERILLECIQVAKGKGYEFGDDFFEKGIAYLSKAGNHKPSTLMDLEAGNPIEYIFQTIIDYGKECSCPAPYLDSLTKVVKALEYKRNGQITNF